MGTTNRQIGPAAQVQSDAQCPVCAAPTLHALPSFGPGAFACDACQGFWLDAPARAWLTPAFAPASSDGDRGTCLHCRAPLKWQPFRGPTTQLLGLCSEHGAWFTRTGLVAISDAALRVRLVRAIVEHNRRLAPELGRALIHAVDSVATRANAGPGMSSIVRPLGNPDLVAIGVGAVAMGGVVAIAADGRARQLAVPSSRWTMSVVVAAILGPILGGLWIYMLLSEDLMDALLLGIVLAAVFVFGTGMFVMMALVEARWRIVFDSQNRNIDLSRNGRLELRVPYALALNTRVQLYVDPGYADRYDVLVNVGFAELWIVQTMERHEAHATAAELASHLGVPVDPEEERKT